MVEATLGMLIKVINSKDTQQRSKERAIIAIESWLLKIFEKSLKTPKKEMKIIKKDIF